jgi:CRP-like cAMP-binding protein
MVNALKSYLGRFADITEDDFQQIMDIAEVRTYDKRIRLTNIGEKEYYLNFVVRGLVRKFFNKGDEEVITQIAREGELISSSVSFLSGEQSMYIVETIEPTTFLSFSLENVEKLYNMDIKWQRMGRLIITDLFLQKETWDMERMLYSTQERFVRFVNSNSVLFQRVPQKYLASYLNIQPETFSRLKHLLKSRNNANTVMPL